MYLFIETIRIENRQIENIAEHNKRLNATRFELLGCKDFLNIENYIDLSIIPDQRVYKCRLIYNYKIAEVDISPYTVRHINTLKLVNVSKLDYSYKYADRSAIDQLFQLRENCDDIIIVRNF